MRTKPRFLIGTPMCKAFSSLQALNQGKRDPEVVRREMVEAEMHLRFSCELYELQLKRGDYFVHEHPASATSWRCECMRRIMAIPGVIATVMPIRTGVRRQGRTGAGEEDHPIPDEQPADSSRAGETVPWRSPTRPLDRQPGSRSTEVSEGPVRGYLPRSGRPASGQTAPTIAGRARGRREGQGASSGREHQSEGSRGAGNQRPNPPGHSCLG